MMACLINARVLAGETFPSGTFAFLLGTRMCVPVESFPTATGSTRNIVPHENDVPLYWRRLLRTSFRAGTRFGPRPRPCAVQAFNGGRGFNSPVGGWGRNRMGLTSRFFLCRLNILPPGTPFGLVSLFWRCLA